jgi:hypothetical protein
MHSGPSGQGLHAESSRPALMLVDHETYSPELDQMFPEGQTITMLAVFRNDQFNQLVRWCRLKPVLIPPSISA